MTVCELLSVIYLPAIYEATSSKTSRLRKGFNVYILRLKSLLVAESTVEPEERLGQSTPGIYLRSFRPIFFRVRSSSEDEMSSSELLLPPLSPFP